ncbi:MAG: glycosyltransferase involved in cell wall biosynthesis [Myxococcota bacterium]|jgi:glycosyltransferase involved in cell wall biosynthesis
MKLNLLFVLPSSSEVARGNSTTAKRLAKGLISRKHLATIVDVSELDNVKEKFDLVIACHAVNSAPKVKQWCAANNCQYVVLFTGTDLNGKPSKQVIEAIEAAEHCVSLGAGAGRRAKDLFECCRGKTTIIPQAVLPLPRSTANDLPKSMPALNNESELVLVPNGIRSIKNVSETLSDLVLLAKERPQMVVCFAGHDFGGKYSDEFMAALKKQPWAHYLGNLSTLEFSAVVNKSKIALSSSHSEGGAPNALLECIAAGRPALGSDIAAHRELLGGENCFAYGKDLRRKVRAILEDPQQAMLTIRKLEEKVRFKHGINAESLGWDRLLLTLTKGS